jgi:hypothetical protein
MATLSTTLYTAQLGSAGASTNAGANFPLAKNAYGKLRIVQVPYPLLSTEAANDILNLTILKAGARVIAGLSKVICEDPGTTLTVSVGDASDRARYSGTIVLSAGGSVEFSSVAGTDLYVPTDIASTTAATTIGDSANQTVITAKVIAAGTLTAAAKLLFLLAVVDE